MSKPLVVITGASSGIGVATAQRFSEAGHPLLLLARRLKKIKALNLPNSICCKVDVADRSAFVAAIKEGEDQFGPVDCLINNAGVMLLGKIDSQDAEEWKKMFDVNVLALLNGMQAVLSDMKLRRTGTIINISSVAGKKTFPNHAAYCGTKFAVSAISENVREEMASTGVRVMSVCPGMVETELISHTTSQTFIDTWQGCKNAIGGALTPDDVARVIVFMYAQSQNINIREVVITPTRQRG